MKIKVDKNGNLICICGNTVDNKGFEICEDAGVPVEPLYRCMNCFRIINQDTHEIVGNGEDFPIISLSWQDLKGRFSAEEIAKLTENDMIWIAFQMADAYVSGQFWSDLDYLVKEVLSEMA